MKGCFVTGTDIGVGKTLAGVVATLVVAADRFVQAISRLPSVHDSARCGLWHSPRWRCWPHRLQRTHVQQACARDLSRRGI